MSSDEVSSEITLKETRSDSEEKMQQEIESQESLRRRVEEIIASEREIEVEETISDVGTKETKEKKKTREFVKEKSENQERISFLQDRGIGEGRTS